MKKTFAILGKRGRITIPYELRRQVGFQENDVLPFSLSEDGRTVDVRREKLGAAWMCIVIQGFPAYRLNCVLCRRL